MVVDGNNTNWLFDIFSWEHLSAVVTVFALLTSTAIIPVWQLLKKRKAEREKLLDERETNKIKAISEEIIKPVVSKLEEHDEMVKEIKLNSKENDKNTRDTLNTVRALVSEFHSYKDQQHKINAKLYFLDGALRSGNMNANRPPENNYAYKDWRFINSDDEDENNNNK